MCVSLSKATVWIIYLLAIVTAAYMIVPTLIVIPISFADSQYLIFPPKGVSTRWYAQLVSIAGYSQTFENSVKIGISAALMSGVLGTLAALAVVRGKIWFGRLVAALVLAPMILPQIILAIGLMPVLAWINLLGGFPGIIIAHTVIGIPLVFITVGASLRVLDSKLEMAALTLGANLWQTFWRITFPLIRPGILVGVLFAFATSFDELIISLFLTDAFSMTLPKFMFGEMRYQQTPTIAAASTVVLLISLSVLALTVVLQRGPKRQPR